MPEDLPAQTVLIRQCKALELSAGISDQLRMATAGKTKVGDPSAYRTSLRKAYFSVENLEIRRQLMRVRKAYEAQCIQDLLSELDDIESTLQKVAREKQDKKLKALGAFLAIPAVAFVIAPNYWHISLILGSFAAYHIFDSDRAETDAFVSRIREERRWVESYLDETRDLANVFNAMELATGERFDHQL